MLPVPVPAEVPFILPLLPAFSVLPRTSVGSLAVMSSTVPDPWILVPAALLRTS